MAEAGRAPLSRRKAMLAACLADAFADRLFEARGEPASDILAFRAALAGGSPELALVFDLAGGRADLVTMAVEVPIADYGRLGIEDYMVSLYNQHTVQRLRIAAADGRHDVHVVLAAAAAALRALSTP